MRGIANSLVLVLLASTSLLSCRSPYRIVIGKTYLQENRPRAERRQSAVTASDSLASIDVEGVFGETEIGRRKLPVIWRSDPTVGRNYIILAESLSVEKGSWVKARGTFSTQQFALGRRDATLPLKMLRVEEWQMLANLNPLRDKTQQEYKKIRNRLQTSITPAGSKLRLPEHPDWQLTVDGEAGNAIVSMQINDLMYEAELSFVFRIAESKLLSVYAVERFKVE